MSKKEGELKFSYDNYEDDFHRDVDESGDKRDFNMQTSALQNKSKLVESYEADFQN